MAFAMALLFLLLLIGWNSNNELTAANKREQYKKEHPPKKIMEEYLLTWEKYLMYMVEETTLYDALHKAIIEARQEIYHSGYTPSFYGGPYSGVEEVIRNFEKYEEYDKVTWWWSQNDPCYGLSDWNYSKVPDLKAFGCHRESDKWHGYYRAFWDEKKKDYDEDAWFQYWLEMKEKAVALIALIETFELDEKALQWAYDQPSSYYRVKPNEAHLKWYKEQKEKEKEELL